MSRFLACLATAAIASLAPAMGAQATGFLADGRFLLDLRARVEHVDDGGFADDAEALTLRSRIGWRSGSVNGFHVLVEAEDVRALVDDYNSTANGRTRFPVVVDPEGSEWNQAHIGWKGGARGTELTLGRQRLLFDNQRHVGNVGWRQNEQTFDAFALTHPFDERITLRYAWLDRVHRVFGNQHPNPLQAEHDLDAHLFNLAAKLPVGTLAGYAYLVENEDLPAASTHTSGLRLAGSRSLGAFEVPYAGEFARQRGWRDAPSTGTVDYLHVEAGLRRHGHGLRIGFERLDSNGRRAFQTPLATGHAFNGWADRFLVTPANGLDDRYVKLDGPLGPLKYMLAWHRFDAARGGADHGTEFDAQLGWTFAKRWTLLAKAADYRSDGFGADVRKLWVSAEYRY
jgi:hypothetical protein